MTAVRRAARDGGLVAGLRLLHPPGILPFGPNGHALVTADLARDATEIWHDGVRARRDRDAEKVIREFAVTDGRLVALCHVGLARGAECWQARELAELRLGLSERLLDQCRDYLGGREVGGRQLLDVSLLRGDLADVHLEQLQIDGVLDTAPPAHLHRRLTRVDRQQLRLLGAYGFLDGPAYPGTTADLSELLADAYVDTSDPAGAADLAGV